ncbi:MAG: hypothetical protein L0H63_11185 [Nitrococcus sp.]|nr:hypothetical protein [Nitrococcus sp.]
MTGNFNNIVTWPARTDPPSVTVFPPGQNRCLSISAIGSQDGDLVDDPGVRRSFCQLSPAFVYRLFLVSGQYELVKIPTRSPVRRKIGNPDLKSRQI